MHLFAHPSESHDIRPTWYSLFRLEGHVHHQDDPSIRAERYHGEDVLKPSVDLDTTDHGKTAVATFEIPGVKKSDIKIEVHNGILTISGEKMQQHQRVRNVHSIHERLYGKFVRSLHLPQGVTLKEINASMEDGVLTLTFPNHEHGQEVGQVTVQ